MFVRIVETRSGGKTHRYLRIVENYRENGKIRQRVLWNLGNLDKIRHKLPGLTKSLSNHSGEKFVALKGLRTEAVREYGNMLLLKTTWDRLDVEKVLGSNRAAKRMKPYLMAVTFHHLLNPVAPPPVAEWLDRVYLPEFYGPSRSGKARLNDRVLGLLEYLERDGRGSGLRIISGAARKRTSSFCYIIKLKINALGARGNPLRQKESLLATLTTGGVPWAYGVYDGGNPLEFVRGLLTDNVLGQFIKGRKTTFVSSRQTIGDGAVNLLNREGIPYIAFINRWSKRHIKRPTCRAGRGHVAYRIKTGNKKGPRVYVVSGKNARSRKRGNVEFALKTNMAARAFLTKTVRARKELHHLEDFFGNITSPPGVLPRVEHKRGYIFICLLAYLLKRALDRGLSRTRTGNRLTHLELLDGLKDIKLVTNTASGRRIYSTTKIPRQMRGLLRPFGVKIPRAPMDLPR
ncbi:MAG: hypothetical protein V3V45_07615 [Candidatus Brocadiales bacterium]